MTENNEFTPFELFGSLVYVKTTKGRGKTKREQLWPARVGKYKFLKIFF